MTAAGRLPAAHEDPVADPAEPIARHLAPSPPCAETTFRRRRLATLAGLLGVVLAVAPFVERSDDAVPVTTQAAGSMTVRAASVGSPTAVRELLSQTTSTLVQATGATTTSSTTSTTSSTSSTSAPATTSTSVAPATTTTAAPTTTEAPTTTAAPTTTEAPTTTVHRHPTTTQAPATTTTTAAPSTTASSGYAYDDPRSTQVWYDLAECESGGDWSIDSGNGYYGGLQFSLPTWESVGGTGYPHEHSADTQIQMGRRLQAEQGWGAWPHCSEELGLR